MHIACPACLTTNRVPEDRIDQGPVCGRCGAELAPAHPVDLNDETFARYIERNERPVLVDFWAAWCGPCRMMAPHFDQAAREQRQVQFARLDTEASPQTAARYRIQSIPTLILFQHGKELARQSGAMQAPALVRWLGSQLPQR